MGPKCRLCAENRGDLVAVLEEAELPEKILHLFQVKIALEDRLPTTVCQSCCNTVNETWEFSQLVQKAQELLAQEELKEEEEIALLEPIIERPGSAEMVESILSNATREQPKPRMKSERIKARRCRKKESVSLDSDGLSGMSDYEYNTDGSLVLNKRLEGWENYSWTCCDCHQSLCSADDLRDHHATMHGQSVKYMCSDCPKLYTKYSTFVSHVRGHHTHLRFCCDICGKWFGTSRAQERHHITHCEERPHGCGTCGKRFRVQSSLLVHSRSHLPAELKNKHECDQCPKRFGTKPNLMAHKRIHSGVRDFTCDQCGKSFVQKGNLDNHMLTHTAVRPFNCTICGKSFKTSVRLRKHNSVHSGLKPHQCDVCGRQFRERGTLKEHHRIHTGAMPFTCEFCGKSFRFKGVLTTHRRQHTGERPYSCLECQHHFTNWPNYNKHMKRRHGINTSVTVRKPQSIPPTGMPQRNPPGTVLAPPQPVTPLLATPPGTGTDGYSEQHPSFFPILGLYNLPDELLQQRV